MSDDRVDWYWARGERRLGPVSESEFRERIADGSILKDTLVWRTGWEEWRPLGDCAEWKDPSEEVDDGGEKVVCLYTGELRAKSGMLAYGDGFVAPEHKDAFVLALQQGEELPLRRDREGLWDLDWGFGGAFALGWKLMRRQFGLLLGLYVLGGIPVIVLSYALTANDGTELPEVLRSIRLMMFLDSTIGLVGTAGVLAALLVIWRGREARFGASLASGLALWGKLWVTNFIIGLATLFGFILLVIPGIIVAVRCAIAEMAVANEDNWASRGFSRSWALSQGFFWELFVYGLAIGGAYFLGTMAVEVPCELLAETYEQYIIASAVGECLLLPVEVYSLCLFFAMYQKCLRVWEESGGARG